MDNKSYINSKELQKSLNLIILAITFGMAFFTVVGNPVGGAPFTGFIRALGAGYFVYGIIFAMPVLGGIIQTFASYFLENTGKRKLIFVIFGLIHRLFWIPIAVLPLLMPSRFNNISIVAITIFITLSSVANSITGVAFFSWMGSLIPMDIRGRFFSKRTMISTISAAVTGLIVGRFIDSNPGFNTFAVVFVLAAVFGALDIICFIWVKDPPMEIPKDRIPFFKLFLEPFKNKNYIRFIAFISIWNFGLNIASPFFNVFMIEYLKMSYFAIFLFAQIAGNFTTVLFIQKWGKLVDRFGNKPVMKICCWIIIPLPFLWLFTTPTNHWMILVLNFLTGVVWPGFDMTAMNLSIWLAPEKNRSIYLANYTLVISIIGSVLAFICGGAFMEYTKPVLDNMSIPFFMGQKFNNYHALIILSSLFRFAAVVFFLPKFKEQNAAQARSVLLNIRQYIIGKFSVK